MTEPEQKTAHLLEQIGEKSFLVQRYKVSPVWEGYEEVLVFQRRNMRTLRMETFVFGVAGREALAELIAAGKATQLAVLTDGSPVEEAMGKLGFVVG